jgi:hypothetical protein
MRLLLLLTVLASPLHLLANVTGKILETVSDPSGPVIAGAEITATNAARGVLQHAVSDGFGFHIIQELVLGRSFQPSKKTNFAIIRFPKSLSMAMLL